MLALAEHSNSQIAFPVPLQLFPTELDERRSVGASIVPTVITLATSVRLSNRVFIMRFTCPLDGDDASSQRLVNIFVKNGKPRHSHIIMILARSYPGELSPPWAAGLPTRLTRPS